MKRLLLSAAMLGCFAAAPAYAQATRTWVSGVGDDVNPCSRTAPCKTFAGAISKTATGGEINCLDSGGFGTLTITKSISVVCQGVIGGVLASGGVSGFIVNDSATGTPGTAVVYLEGLDIEGVGTGTSGIRFLSGASLHVKNTTIRDFKAGTAHGIDFATTRAATLVVENTTISNTGTGAAGAAILIRPTAAVSATALISKVHAHRGTFGIVADGTGGTTGINMTIRDSAVNGETNTNILATSNGPGTGIMVHDSAATNGGTGVSATGAGAVVRIGSSVITGNATATSGNVLSYGNNQINGNGADTIPTGVPGGLH